MTTSTLAPDWRKAAASAAQANEDVEKAFLDQAYIQIQNKATPIMKSPYRVGFEIVYKNEDNTRMVGIFVFRVNKELFYAPVFFINGSIKGTDLLYRHTTKTFVPLTNPWVEYLLGMCQMHEGTGVHMRERQNVRQQMDLSQIIGPPVGSMVLPGVSKFASEDKQALFGIVRVGDEESAEKLRAKKDRSKTEEMALKAWDHGTSGKFGKDIQSRMIGKKASSDLCKHYLDQWFLSEFETAKKASTEPSILRKFITEDGGFNAIRKLANTCRQDFEFAKALMACSKPENYMPVLEPLLKAASTFEEGEPVLTLHTNVIENSHVKQASELDVKKGYKVEDKRKDSMVNDVVYTSNEQTLDSITDPGIYSVLLADGSSHEMTCANYEPMDLFYRSRSNIIDAPSFNTRPSPQMVFIDNIDNKSDTVNPQYKAVLGKLEKNIDPGVGSPSPSVGKGYRIFNTKSKSLSEPFIVTGSEKTPAGLTQIKIKDGGCCGSDEKTLLLNPDYEHFDKNEGVFGNCCRFIEVATRTDKSPGYIDGDSKEYKTFDHGIDFGDKYALEGFIFDQGYKKAMVVSRPGNQFLVRTDHKEAFSDELSPLDTLVCLMGACSIKEADAEDAIKAAAEKGKYAFLYKPGEHIKLAYNVRAPAFPQFIDRANSEFGVQEQPVTRFILNSQRDKPWVPPHRIGDSYNPDPSESVDTASPLQLYGMSKDRGVSSLFEHGVVGALTNTYDAIAMVERYLPDLETALDRLGRLIFLFYWKPEDFSEAYGSDDQGQLENQLVSNFKSFGDLVLELLQKSRGQQTGSVSMT